MLNYATRSYLFFNGVSYRKKYIPEGSRQLGEHSSNCLCTFILCLSGAMRGCMNGSRETQNREGRPHIRERGHGLCKRKWGVSGSDKADQPEPNQRIKNGN